MKFIWLTTEDPARKKHGAARISHPQEYEEKLKILKEAGVELNLSRPMLAYSPAKGKPGRFILDKDASISALRHEFKHFLDDQAAGYAGLGVYLENDELYWQMEFRAYFEEIKFAREQKDYDLGRKIVKLMRERRTEIFSRATEVQE
jgi:hypothetical protein